MRKAGSQIIMVAHHDEPTVPDWNINMLAWVGKKKKEGVCVNVSQSVCCIWLHTFSEQHFFCWQMRERQRHYALTKDVREPQMAGSMTYNPVSFPNTPALTVRSGAVLYLWENKRIFPPTMPAVFLHITINKKLISLCWHSFNPSLRPLTRKHLNSRHICIDGLLSTEGHSSIFM